jgi:hypothetical protein
MVFQLRRKILSSRSHQETSPDEEISDSVLSHSRSHSRERDEESGRDAQVEDSGINSFLLQIFGNLQYVDTVYIHSVTLCQY